MSATSKHTVKRFDAAPAPAEGEKPAEPIVFYIGDDRYEVPGDLPGVPLMELAAAIDMAEDEHADDDPEVQTAAMAAWVRFLQSVLGPEQYGRFRKVASRNRWPAERVIDFGGWLVEAVSGVPLDELSSSPSAPTGGSQSSTGASPFTGVAGS